MNVYELVTERVIDQLANGIIPWHKPWICSGEHSAISHTTGKPYSLLNQLMLGRAGEYITFKQAQAEGGHIKKGAKSQLVVFWKPQEVEDELTGEKKIVPYLRYYNVFHIDQCEGIKPRFTTGETETETAGITADEKAEGIITDYIGREGITINTSGSNEAFYSPALDSITLPSKAQFKEVAEYYSTAFHELTHSTGHSSRLNRISSTAFFGSEAYSKEELVAELGASALVNACGIETASSFRNNVAYIQNWLQALKNDKRLIVSASSKAEKAFKLIMGIENKEEEQDND